MENYTLSANFGKVANIQQHVLSKRMAALFAEERMASSENSPLSLQIPFLSPILSNGCNGVQKELEWKNPIW